MLEFQKQWIKLLLESNAVTIMCELSDFPAFQSTKQLFAYFGMDTYINDSGKFKATEAHMSKHGS